MIASYKYFHSLILAGIAALCYRVLLISPDLAQNPDYGRYVWPAVVGVLWLLFSQSHTISRLILETMPWLRRLLAGREFIEGDWPLVVVDVPTGELVYCGFLTIGYKGGYLTVSGNDWRPSGEHALAFKSMQSYYSEGTLHYWYKQGAGGQQRGYTFIEFFPRDAIAQRHTGAFHDKAHLDVRFYARKLKYGRFERRLKTMEQRRQAALGFGATIMPRMPDLLKAAVDVDWE